MQRAQDISKNNLDLDRYLIPFFFPSFYFSGVSNLASSPLPLDEAEAGAGGGTLGMERARTILTVW